MKDQIRKTILKKRNNISKDFWEKNSQKINQRLKELDIFQKSNIVMFYVSYGNEVDTRKIIKENLSRKNIIVPKSNLSDNSLILIKLDNWNDLELGAYNILEPKNNKNKLVKSDELDLIIVPGVVFDETGNRIGHGKGYYDRLLDNAVAVTIGLSFEFQIVDSIMAEKHDKKIDMIITEDRIINCRS